MKMIPMMLLTLIAPIAYAQPMQAFNITNTKEWTTGNTKVHYTITPGKISRAKRTGNDIAGSVITNTSPQQEKVGGLSTITTDSDINFYNATDQKQIINVFNYTCVSALAIPSGKPTDDQCGNYFQSITLEPDSAYTQHFNPELLISFREAGEYTLESVVTVAFSTDANNPVHVTSARSDSTITVT